MPAVCEALLRRLEHATARLLDLNPSDLSAVQPAIAARASAIEDLVTWAGARETPDPPDPEFVARLQNALAAGSAVALRLTLVRLDVTVQLAGMAREKRLLEALVDTRAGKTSGVLDCSG